MKQNNQCKTIYMAQSYRIAVITIIIHDNRYENKGNGKIKRLSKPSCCYIGDKCASKFIFPI